MRILSTLLLCSASVAGLATPALAQDSGTEASTDSSYTENVIIVQTRRRAEDVQDVPAVIDTVSSDQVSKLNLRSFQDVAAVVPGLQLDTESNGVGGGAKLRGVNFDISASGNNPTVEFYFNDAPITAGVILQQMYDIGMIEVQRGPQGTLRGRASPSGSITVAAKKPDLYEVGGFVDMTANDIGTINYKGAVNIPVIEGVAAIRAAGVWDENEGDRVRSIYSNRDPFSRTKSGRISALIQPTDWLKLEGMYQRLDRTGLNYTQVASFSEVNPAAPASPVYISSSDRLSNMATGLSTRQIYDIYNWRSEVSALGQVLIYQGQHYTQKITGMESQDKGDFFSGGYFRDNFSDISSTSHEVRLQNDARIADIFDYVLGFFDYKNSTPTDLVSRTIIGYPTNATATAGAVAAIVKTNVFRTGQSHEQSFFGNLTAHIGDSTEIAGGLRHIDYNDANGLDVPTQNLHTTSGESAKKWIYSASLKHNFTPDLMVYASTGSSWRPGLNVVGDFSVNQSALEQSFLNLPAESSKSYEIGMKSTLLGGRAKLNLTAYHQKFKNYPYRVPGQGIYYVNEENRGYPQVSQFNFVGAVPVEVNGIEGDLSVAVTDNWDVGLTAAYSIGKIKSGTIPCNDLLGDGVPDSTVSAPTLKELQDAVGTNNLSACTVSQRSGFQSPFSATLTSEYRIPVSDAVEAYVRGLFNFNGNSRVDPTNVYDDVNGYGLLNIYTGIRAFDGAWSVSLFAKNLLDTTKTLTRSDPLFTSYRNAAAGYASTTYTSTYTAVTATAPREFGINVRYAFGSR